MRNPGNRAKKILVLLHENDGRVMFETQSLIGQLARYWQRDGHEVLVQSGIREFTPADVVVLHVNLSVVPDEYLRFAQRYPASVNGHVQDIRKSSFSQNLVSPGDGFSGPVIAKCDYNYNGGPERRLLHDVDYASPFSEYEIYEHPGEIPASYWTHPNVVVEKFIPETDGDAFYLRMYQFLGDQEFWVRIMSWEPLVKHRTTVQYQECDPNPVIREWRKRLRVDYGKFDYVISDGMPILLDINKTQGHTPRIALYLESLEQRAKGIEAFFR